MERMSLAEAELSRHDWSALRCAGGPATGVPQELRGLLAATNGEERHKHYWKLDNNVVVQGNLYEAAVPVVSVLCAALADGNTSPYAHSGIVELLFQLVCGEPHGSEIVLGRSDLDVRVKEAALPALWLFYRELATGYSDLANMILEELDPDRARYEFFVAAAIKAGRKVDLFE